MYVQIILLVLCCLLVSVALSLSAVRDISRMPFSANSNLFLKTFPPYGYNFPSGLWNGSQDILVSDDASI